MYNNNNHNNHNRNINEIVYNRNDVRVANDAENENNDQIINIRNNVNDYYNNLPNNNINNNMTGGKETIYVDNASNRRLGRVGKVYTKKRSPQKKMPKG